MTTTMMNMPLLTPDFPHLFNQHVEVDGFTFQEPALDFDLEDDDEAAKDIDDFTSLLASVDDEETARDIDDFATLMNALSKSQEKEADMSDVSIEDLLDVTKEASADVSMDHSDSESEYDDDEDEETAPVFNPALSFRAPIDPRCCIQSPIFRKIDSRIPMVSIPKMDVAFEKTATASAPVKPLRLDLRAPASSTPSSPCRSVVSSDDGEASATYVHNADKCWVCKSNKSEERKRVLHRYMEKRYRRNWKRGARYTARSRVASSRVREGGRFVTKCEWVPVNYS